MDKVVLNNQIVLMRKHVKQAKIHTINKIVKQMKSLKNRKGNETQILKNKRKEERLLEEISLLKKLKPDCVSKLALSRSKNWNEILNEKNATLEDRCIALLATFEPVKKAVELFYESKKDLVAKIPDLLKQWEEKSRFPRNSSGKKKSSFKNDTSQLKRNSNSLNLLNNEKNQSEISNNQNYKSFKEESENTSITNDPGHNQNMDNSSETLKDNGSMEFPNDSLLMENKSKDTFVDRNNLEKNFIAIDKLYNSKSKQKTISKSVIDDNIRDDSDESDVDSESNEDSESKNNSIMEDNRSENFDYKPDINSSIKDCEVKTKDTRVEYSSPEILEFKKKSSQMEENLSECENVEASGSISKKLVSKEIKSTENKLKTITLLNLDELQDLDEIPVGNLIENEESETEDSEEESSNDPTENDPFFLGRDEAESVENSLIDAPKSNNSVPISKIFERREKQYNQPDFKKDFKKNSNNSQFFKTDFSRTKNERNFKSFNNEKKFQGKGNFNQDNFRNRFQSYKQNNFERNSKSHRQFEKKPSFEIRENKNRSSNNWLNKKEIEKHMEKPKGYDKKDNISNKPLHPSWEAKRKEKEIINTTFQGKKIKFED